MRDKEFIDFGNAYKQICEHVNTTVEDESDIYDQVLEYLLSEGYSKEESNQIMIEIISESGLGSLVKGLGSVAKFIQRRASTPVKTAVTDLATTALAAGGTPTPAKIATNVARSAAPTPIVRTVKSPVVRTAPKGANVSPDPWKGSSGAGNKMQQITRGSTPKPSSQKSLTGSPTPKTLGGSPTRASLPSGTKGGALAKTTPGGAITSAAKPTSSKITSSKIEPVKVKDVTSTGKTLSGSPTRGSLPSGTKGGAISKTTPGGAITPVTKPSTKLTGSKIEPVKVKDVTSTGRTLSGSRQPAGLLNPAKSQRSQQFKDVQRLTRSTGGGLMGTTKPTNLEPRAPKPAWGSSAVKPTTSAKPQLPKASPVDKTVTPTSSKPAVKPAAKPSGGSADIPKSSKGLKRLGATVAGAAALGVAADMAFPRSTAPGTPDKAPKFPTTAKEVKKGQTYYDPNTRVGTSQRFAQRKKVGAAKIGSSFEDAFKFYRERGDKTFKYGGKEYTTKMKENMMYEAKDETEEGITGLPIPKKKMSPKKRHEFEKKRRVERKKRNDPRVGDGFSQHRMTGSGGHGSEYQNTRSIREEIITNYLLDAGFASDEKSAQAIVGAMSEDWKCDIMEAVTGGSAPPNATIGRKIC